MKNCIIQTTNLNYAYGSRRVLDDVSLAVPAGSIFGFLGLNGSGKTTTIRLLLGVNDARGQRITLFGQSITDQRVEILRRAGALIETPVFYPHLSGYGNMEIARLARNASKTEVDQALDMVGITKDASRLVKTYSLGMRQRLGIALALLGDPELLILDEPTNGLDPAGAHEIRLLLTRLCKLHGKTIFISSHLLNEMEKILTHAAILHKGHLLFQGPIADLKALGRSMNDRNKDPDLEEIFLNLTAK
jgi:ABC-type multidrug transport system ATPase subunit